MANRRMLNKTVVESDPFFEMPADSQALYMHLVLNADDEGFVGNPETIRRMTGFSKDSLKLLIAKGFLISFQSGVVVVTHWEMQNKIQPSRKTKTIFTDEKGLLIVDEQGKYLIFNNSSEPCQQDADKMSEECQRVADKTLEQVSIGKDSIGKDSIDNILCASVPDGTAKANHKKEANELFEQLWKAYPSKKGKAQVSDTAKARLLKIGYDEMMRAIDRYTYDLEKDSDWRKPQNGSTFFNSGYVDYLDANYKSIEDAQKESDAEKARELERRCWGDVKPIDDDDLPFKYEG